MLDADVVAVSASSVYRVLKGAGLLGRFRGKPSSKGKGFHQPSRPHRHWHVDIAYVNICGTFYFMTSILDGYSRYLVHWEIREKMEEIDVEAIVQRAREKFPGENPRMITDNGPQFISKDFKQFVRICGMTHVRTSPYYPQSNGKLERYHRTIKSECIRPQTPLSLGDARRIVARFVARYNEERLHSALGYVTPRDKLDGREQEIYAERDRKLEEARRQRQERHRERQRAAQPRRCYTERAWAEDRATQRCDPSADPGPEARVGGVPTGAVGPFPLASGAMR
jgi:transposase InsO family protein